MIEYVCTSIFVLEILCNLFVHWWSEFFTDGWNYFDTIAVALSVTAFFVSDLPGPYHVRYCRSVCCAVSAYARATQSLVLTQRSLLSAYATPGTDIACAAWYWHSYLPTRVLRDVRY